jgi:hypothetical protein
MDKLREEIIEAQKIRADLIKWKLVLVAGLGAAGLGLKGNYDDRMLLILSLIPFVCVYVDLLARHLNLRMHVIAEFIRQYDNDVMHSKYEEFAKSKEGIGVYSLETGALKYSTLFLSSLVMVAGFIVRDTVSCTNGGILLFSGILGVLSAFAIDIIYRNKMDKIKTPTSVSD